MTQSQTSDTISNEWRSSFADEFGFVGGDHLDDVVTADANGLQRVQGFHVANGEGRRGRVQVHAEFRLKNK